MARAAARVRRERAALSYRSSLNSCMSNWSGFGSVNCEPSASWPGRIGDICSIKSTRAARIRDRRTSLSAMISACSRSIGSAPLPHIAVASWSISALSAGSRRIVAARPCRRALRRTCVFPAAVRGPVLRCELRRLAAIWRLDAMARPLAVADQAAASLGLWKLPSTISAASRSRCATWNSTCAKILSRRSSADARSLSRT